MRIFLSLILFLCAFAPTPAHACAMMMEIPEEAEAKEPKLLAALMDEIDASPKPEVIIGAEIEVTQPDSDATPEKKDTNEPQS